MAVLSDETDKILRKHGINIDAYSYVFEPRVFTISANDVPEALTRSREAIAQAILENSLKKDLTIDTTIDFSQNIKMMKCLPQCGLLDPLTLRELEKFRIADRPVSDDPIPALRPDEVLINSLVGDKQLHKELSQNIFSILKENKVTLRQNEGCVFTPFVFETPIFAQRVGKAANIAEMRGFGPQVYADPTPQPIAEVRIKPFPGIIETRKWRTVGVIVTPWWWVGIPAPEILRALDVFRQAGVK